MTHGARMNKARDETAEARPTNKKGKEKKKLITESEGEASKSYAHTPAREYYCDSEGKEPKTKAGKV